MGATMLLKNVRILEDLVAPLIIEITICQIQNF